MPGNAALACRLFFASAFVAGTPVVCANPTDTQGPGYQDKTIQAPNGKPMVVRVMNSVGPTLHGGSSEGPGGRYDPENMDLGRSSSFSHKQFSAQDAALSQNDTADEARGEHAFQTKSFSNSNSSIGGFDQKFQTSSFNSGKSDDAFGKSFITSSSKLTQGKDASFATKNSEFQNVSSPLADSKKEPYNGFSDMSDKKFFDPAMTHIKRDPYAAANNLDVKRMADLPNRALTIDEVRNLINHETIPDLNSKPEAPSKALNDPDYEPPVAVPLKHDDLQAPGPEEKDSELPSPGMMATPSSDGSEPLPK